MNTQSSFEHLPGNLTLDALLAAKEEMRAPPPLEIWVASYGPDGMNAISLPAVSVLGGVGESRYSHSLADRVVIMRREVLEKLLADGVTLTGIPIYYKEEEE